MGLCRLCASLKEPKLLLHIKEQSNEICQKLLKCCRVSIQMSDAMPKSVCQSCVDQLNVSYNFYSKVQEAQETLEALFHSKLAETHIHDVFLQGDDSLPNDTQTHASKHSMTTEKDKIIDPSGHQKTSLRIKAEKVEVEDQLTTNTLFIGQQVDQSNNNKSGSGDDSPIKDCHNLSTLEQSTTADKEEITELEKSQLCNIKIEMEDEEDFQQAADTDRSSMFAIANVVSIAEDGSKGDSDCYLNEIYNILGMTHDDVYEGPTPEENESTNFLVSTIVKEEAMIQEEQNITLLEAHNANLSLDLKYEELEEDSSQNSNESTGAAFNTIGVEDGNKTHVLLPVEKQLTSWKSYKYHCCICEHTSSSFKDLILHANDTHSISDKNKLQYKCYDCQKSIEHYNDFLNHVRLEHHPALQLRCDACDFPCTDYQQYELHRNVKCVEAEKFPNIFTCSYCCKTFRTFGEKKVHFRQHLECYPKIKCKHCHKEFISNKNLSIHEKCHKPKTPTIACDHCNEVFISKCALNIHISTHSNRSLYKCHICQREFKTHKYLERHQIIHSDEKPFKCSYCPRQFRTKVDKTSHERVHTGETPFPCSQCGQRFRFRSALSSHLLTHSDVRSHTCQYCSRQFKDRSAFRKHIRRIHTSEMPFQCSQCEKCFRFRNAFSAHLKTHSGIREHTCKYCSKQFKDRSNFRKHMYKHAEEESKEYDLREGNNEIN